MTKEKEYYELEMAYELLDEIETESLSEEVAGNIIDAWGFLKLWLNEHRTPQPTFKVGEYYADSEYIYRIEQNDTAEVYVSAFNTVASIWTKAYWALVDIANDKPATAEQIATFKRAEQFAKHGRKLDEFKQGDQVQNIDAGAYGVVDSLYDGDVVLQYHKKGPLYKSVPECLTLIQTAEELQEEAE